MAAKTAAKAVSRRRRQRHYRHFPDRVRTAIHEAAHAVAAVVVGRDLYEVSIARRDDREGLTVTAGLRSYAPFERVVAETLLCLSGMVAEQIATGCDAIPHGVESDLREALRWLARGDGALPDALAMARRLLLRHWGLVERVAGVLLAERELRGVEVRRLLAA
jgi:hypothetical protein